MAHRRPKLVLDRQERNGRGVYHETAAGKYDMVLQQDHRGRWRIDLVTTKTGNHLDVTGPNKGYDSAEEAFQAALDVQRTRGIRGKSHVWIADRDGFLTDYVPEEARAGAAQRELEWMANLLRRYGYDPADAQKLQAEGMGPEEIESRLLHHPGDLERTHGLKKRSLETNGRRTGILSDGSRVNVYYDDSGSGDPWTVVPHGMEWDAQARGDMRSMLGLSEHGTGISQWSEGQEGRHLGRSVPWDAVPPEIKRHIERRIVQESSMVANARRKKSVTVAELPASPGRQVLVCPGCQAEYSAASGDYFMMPQYEKLACSACEVPLVLTQLNANGRIPESLQPYADWSYEDFYQDALDDGRSRQQARLDATRASHAIGRLGFMPPRNLPPGWVLVDSPIFRRRDAKPAYWAHKGSLYRVFGLDGKPISPELRRIRGLIEWKEANGWVSGR